MSRSSLTIAVGLVLGATAAAAAPVQNTAPPGNGPVQQNGSPYSCPEPSDAKCISDGYIDTVCGQFHIDRCRGPVRDKMKEFAEDANKPEVQMLQPNKTQLPANLKMGQYFAYAPKATVATKHKSRRKPYEVADDALAGYQGMNMAAKPPVRRKETVDPNVAKNWHRNTAWRDNGRAVRSCKEYAYARSYSTARFVDAASACKGDEECVFDIAYMPGEPGIADRPRLNEDGIEMPAPAGSEWVPKWVQKNDLFARNIEGFVRANGRDEDLPETKAIRDLVAVLKAGQSWYGIGVCEGNACDDQKKFRTPMKWHKKLHDLTTSMSQAEAEEYERRRAEFRSLLEKWAAAVAGEVIEMPEWEQQLVLPFDMRARDPFERFDLETQYIERGRVNDKALKKKFGAQIFQKPRAQALQQIRGAAAQQQQGSYHRGGMATGMLAMPAPTPAKPSKPSKPPPQAQQADDHTPAPDMCLRAQDEWGLETHFDGPISCRIGKFLRDEWARKTAGHRSCLDLENPRCDWTPQMFEAFILERIPSLDVQISDEQYCEAYLDTDTFKDAGNMVATVTMVKQRLDHTKTLVEKELKAVAEYRKGKGDVGQRLGKSWEGGEYLGDPDWFAAGYEYDVGFAVEPAAKNGDGLVCELKGSVHGDMGFDAWFAGKKSSVVSGNVRVRSKPGQAGKAEVNASLLMFKRSVFNTDGYKGTQTIEGGDPTGDFGVSVPSGIKPRFDVYVGVPVSGEVWGELMFGSALGVTGTGSNGCNANDVRFGVGAEYMPFFGAFGVGQVGVGISGVASAGIRASITLIMLGMPIDFGMTVGEKSGKETLTFASNVKMFLATLGGRVSLYVEFMGFDEEFEMLRWKGFSTDVPLLRLNADVSMVGLK